ncbi:MAG: hypothetical protein GOMPHAMPRED_001359 [Gomphillus americanus]|uniref:Uncharacterized protein n=1 Tax=Gomphillus americanus TaxID=1940652 RepID=A0A8H3F486_9LECA|nr:MAG: hypothetical protein GOMPHAMPRED_001359 [Gomphillus americanus]
MTAELITSMPQRMIITPMPVSSVAIPLREDLNERSVVHFCAKDGSQDFEQRYLSEVEIGSPVATEVFEHSGCVNLTVSEGSVESSPKLIDREGVGLLFFPD